MASQLPDAPGDRSPTGEESTLIYRMALTGEPFDGPAEWQDIFDEIVEEINAYPEAIWDIPVEAPEA